MNKPIERPVIFSAQEVNAVLAGDKTQHRVIFDFAIMQDHNCPFGEVSDRLWVQEFHAIQVPLDSIYLRNLYVCMG